jgi:phosphoglucomutase
VNDLRNVVDMEVTRAAGVELGVDTLGGAAQRIVDNALF